MKILIIIWAIVTIAEIGSLVSLHERIDDLEKTVYHATIAFPDEEDKHDSDN